MKKPKLVGQASKEIQVAAAEPLPEGALDGVTGGFSLRDLRELDERQGGHPWQFPRPMPTLPTR
jgi:hypothetical protein